MSDEIEWTPTYLRARARVAKAYGRDEDHFTVINDAAALARLQLAESRMNQTAEAIAASREEADRAATDALLARLRATAPEAQPDATSDPAHAALKRSVERLNARRGGQAPEANEASPTVTERTGEREKAEADEGTTSESDAKAVLRRAVAKINANR